MIGMNATTAFLPALLLTGCIGATLIACLEKFRNNQAQPECHRCGCPHQEHEQRFGDPGHCHQCIGCYRYERS